MRTWVTVMVLSCMGLGCAGDNPTAGPVQWRSEPYTASPGPLFGVAWSKRNATGWTVFATDYDDVLRCNDVPDTGTLEATFTDAALAQLGDVPIVVTLDPAGASATLRTQRTQWPMGTIHVDELDDRIHATFEAATSEATVSGYFDAARCD